jgi:HK97 gp10 family phage protein
MAKGISSEIDNKALLKALAKLPFNIQKNVMVGSTRAGAKVVSDEAKRLVPVRYGRLKKSIGVLKRKSKRGEVIFSVSPRKGGKNNGFYGRFIELGTSKMIARPFLRPALEKSVDEVLVASKKYIEKRLPREVAKARR